MNIAAIKQRLDDYEKLVRLDKPIGILLLLWPTLWALWIASSGKPSWLLLWVFAFGTVLMRSAGCAINDYADRHFDGAVERTKNRPLAAGRIKPWEALMVAAALAVSAFAMTVLATNRLTIYLSFIAAFVAASYPFTKRFFAIPQAYLGIAFGFGIPMAFAAVLDTVPPIAWWLLLANVFWAIAYDTAYAMVDRDDDVNIGIKTSALLFGRFDVVAVVCCYAAFLGLMAWSGTELRMGIAYYVGLGVAALIACYHLWLIRTRDRMLCFKAFLHNNWLGAAVFAGVALDYAIRRGVFARWLA